jgi:hypothetical protein
MSTRARGGATRFVADAVDGARSRGRARTTTMLLKIVAILIVAGLVAGLFYLGARIPPNNSSGEG